MSPEVHACPDAHALHATFVARLREAVCGRRHPLDPITVVAPTTRLLAALQVATARDLGAVAGVSFLPYGRLAERLLERSGEPPRALLPPVAIQALIGSIALEVEELKPLGELRRAGRALSRAIRAMRESGVGVVPSAAKTEPLVRVHRAVSEAMARGERTDEPELMHRAANVARATAASLGRVLHVGAYDVIGVTARLLSEIACATRVEHLVLGAGGGPAFRWAATAAAKSGMETGKDERAPRAGTPPLAPLLDVLFAGDATAELAPGRLTGFEVAGTIAELEVAGTMALRWHGCGVPLEEIAIVARSLDDYAPHLTHVFGRMALPFTSSASLPLLRRPAARAVLELFELPGRGFSRDAVCELLRSPQASRLRMAARVAEPDGDRPRPTGAGDGDRRGEDPPAIEPAGDDADAVDRMARRLGLRRGLDGWKHASPRHPALGSIATVLEDAYASLSRALEARSWIAALAGARGLVSALLGTPETDGELASPLLAIGTLALLEGVAPPPDDIGSLASWVRHVLSEARDPVCGRDRGGVRVLDMMQARGLAFRRVVIAGVHEGALPRIPTEDPFVRHVAGTVTPAASTPPDGPDSDDASDLGEERLLFGLALAAASEEACVTWQRADDAQRPRSLSPFLREVWRAIGDPGPGHDLSAFQRLPTHPALFASQLAAATGLLEPSRALSAIGMLAPTDRSAAVAGVARSLGVMDRGLDAGLRHVAATDAFEARRGREPEDLAFDGWVGEAPSESTRAPMAVSQLDRLGDCPLKHFFGGRLGVRALESPEDELIEPRAIGMAVHGLLKTLYERLPLPWNDTAAVLAEARRLLPALVREALAPVAHGPLLGYDALARAEEGKWRVAVSELLGRDVPLLAERRVREIHVEKEVAQTIAIGPREVLMTGRYDRVATFAAAGEPEEVADYKTGRSAVTRVASAADAIGGRNLQLFVYALIREAESGLLPLISALSVRPLDRRGRPVGAKEVASGTLRAEIRPSVVAAHRVALERTIGTLLDLRARGLFPISPTDESCRFCDFRSACRTSHAPTRARVASAAPFAAYYALSRRSSR